MQPPSLHCQGNVCVDDSCSDNIKNGDESDIDCGGSCLPCTGPEDDCEIDQDCLSNNCSEDGECIADSCTDNIKNGDESDIDCGGSCPTCDVPHDGCTDDSDCGASLICVSGECSNNLCDNDFYRNCF